MRALVKPTQASTKSPSMKSVEKTCSLLPWPWATTLEMNSRANLWIRRVTGSTVSDARLSPTGVQVFSTR